MMYNVNLKSFDFKQIKNQVEELFKSAPNQNSFNEQFNVAFPEANCVKLPANLAKASSASLLKKFNNLSDTQLRDVFAKIVCLMQNEEADHLLTRLQKYLDKVSATEAENDHKPEYVTPNVTVTEVERTANIEAAAPAPFEHLYCFWGEEETSKSTIWQRIRFWFYNLFN